MAWCQFFTMKPVCDDELFFKKKLFCAPFLIGVLLDLALLEPSVVANSARREASANKKRIDALVQVV